MPTVKVVAVKDVPPGTGRVVQAGGKALAVFNINGVCFALDNRCTHVGGPLGQGRVDGGTVICPWHGSRFDIATGNVLGPPARRPVATYPVTVEGGVILVDLGEG
ncbi:MAG TPA: non-heme iron oxygenase ferredoxin subunit [bacterium]|nr:non-heme iron oxygenase ferredoxin subunit [bacterium]